MSQFVFRSLFEKYKGFTKKENAITEKLILQKKKQNKTKQNKQTNKQTNLFNKMVNKQTNKNKKVLKKEIGAHLTQCGTSSDIIKNPFLMGFESLGFTDMRIKNYEG